MARTVIRSTAGLPAVTATELAVPTMAGAWRLVYTLTSGQAWVKLALTLRFPAAPAGGTLEPVYPRFSTGPRVSSGIFGGRLPRPASRVTKVAASKTAVK